MGRTQINSNNIKNVQRNDMDITTTGESVITKVIAGSNVSLSSTGVDAGTGDVTVNAPTPDLQKVTDAGNETTNGMHLTINSDDGAIAKYGEHHLTEENLNVIISQSPLDNSEYTNLTITANASGYYLNENAENSTGFKQAYFGVEPSNMTSVINGETKTWVEQTAEYFRVGQRDVSDEVLTEIKVDGTDFYIKNSATNTNGQILSLVDNSTGKVGWVNKPADTNLYNSDGTLTGDRNVNGNEGGTQHILNFDGFDTFHVQGANVDLNSDYVLSLHGGDGTQVSGNLVVTGTTALQSSLDAYGSVNIGDANGDYYYNRLSIDVENGNTFLGSDTGGTYRPSYISMNVEDSVIILNSDVISCEGLLDIKSSLDLNGLPGTAGQVLKSNGPASIPSWTTIPTLASGTYTPTITNVTDVTASSVSTWQYMRVGNVVTVSGQYTITTATGHNTQATIRLSLPVASNFSAAYQLTGSSNAIGASDFGYTPQISADATNDRMKIDVFPASVPQTYSVHATYLII